MDNKFIIALVLIGAAFMLRGHTIENPFTDFLSNHPLFSNSAADISTFPNAPSDSNLLALATIVKDGFRNNKVGVTGIELAKVYRDEAYVLQHDDKNWIDTTAKVRALNARSGSLLNLHLINEDGSKKYPDLHDKIDKVIEYAVGNKLNKKIDTDTKQKVVDAFNALSWATYEGSK